MDAEDVEAAVEKRRIWLAKQLDTAATRLAVSVTGEPVNTYDMRSAGAVARDDGADVWLRVVVEDPDYEPASRWDGNAMANAIIGVAKPFVLRWIDWRHGDGYLRGRRLRGEVMTLAPGETVSTSGGVLHDDPELPASWWDELRWSLTALATYPMLWHHELGAVESTTRGVREHFGVTLPADVFTEVTWTTAHADLHWGNLRRPDLCILDWESWRPEFAGYDFATLYCSSLLHSPTAERIRAMPELQTRSGHLALLSAISRYLRIAGGGSDYDLLEPHLRAEAQAILADLT
ncbi:hypothetical protein GCM10022222_51920 [Amycolatopsis ultiminotia]|uniref:Aminoglycoside phosphotransferase domain-containing protein n=1 Tax=Amycolatopsis ultiminotia TaxID=543629 RepID=A0ABP6X5D2_9PSEU